MDGDRLSPSSLLEAAGLRPLRGPAAGPTDSPEPGGLGPAGKGALLGLGVAGSALAFGAIAGPQAAVGAGVVTLCGALAHGIYMDAFPVATAFNALAGFTVALAGASATGLAGGIGALALGGAAGALLGGSGILFDQGPPH